jgi:hypothetical protein
MQGLAGATGGETATGTALRSAGPSGGYGGKVAAKVKPNIVFPDQVDGNPRAEVEVLAAPDGTISKHASPNPAATRPGTTPCSAPCSAPRPCRATSMAACHRRW